MHADKLPHGRHSSVWLTRDEVVLRLDRRKRRPKGSILRRQCTCKTSGERCCLFHRMQKFLPTFSDGDRLFDISASAFLRMLKAILEVAGMENVQTLWLKTFRSGHATWLALSGAPLTTILEMGEWKTIAALTYIDSNSVDAKTFIKHTVEASDDEGA